MSILKYSKDDQREPTGVGADLFIRKNKPGPAVGVGYTVDIFENGVKTNAIQAENKEQVKEVIQEYKIKYNTSRAFNNENLLHITYKTKEERGEMPTKQLTEPLQSTSTETKKEVSEKPVGDLGKTTQKEKTPGLSSKQNLPKMTERGETAMESLDTLLHKKADTIRILLNKLVDPTLPVMKRGQTDVEQGAVDFLPQTPLPGEEDSASESLNVDDIAKKLSTKLVEYVQQNVNEPIDTLYNDIKSWMADVKKNLKNWERSVATINNFDRQVTAAGTIDRKELSRKIKDIVTSGDPEKIQQELNLPVDEQVADILQKVTLMEIGSPPLKKEEGEQKSLSESLGKAASDTKALAEKVLGITQTADSDDAVSTARETIKDLIGDSLDKLQEVFINLPENLSGTAIAKALEEIEDDLEEGDMNNKEEDDIKLIELKTSDFWNFARNCRKSIMIKTAFEDWANKNELSLDQATNLWNKVKSDMINVFLKKRAIIEADPVASIQVTYTGDRGVADLIYKAKFKVDETSYRVETGKILITEPEAGDDRISSQFDSFFREELALKIPDDYSDENQILKKKIGTTVVLRISEIIKDERNFGKFEALNTAVFNAIRSRRSGYITMSFYVMSEPVFQLTYDGETVSYGPRVDTGDTGAFDNTEGSEDESPEPPEEV